jgi:hypothetical protein
MIKRTADLVNDEKELQFDESENGMRIVYLLK